MIKEDLYYKKHLLTILNVFCADIWNVSQLDAFLTSEHTR